MFQAWNRTLAGVLLGAPLLVGCASADPSGPDGTQIGTTSSELKGRVCRTPDDCPQPGVACRLCPDGVNFTCPEATCTDGQCGLGFTPCPTPDPTPDPTPGLIACGGFAGRPCPVGFECVDDPRDDCSPCRGGADCGGICVQLTCESKPSCDPTLICQQVLTCVDGKLFPTSCGPRNCDAPIGPCDATTTK